MTHYICLLRGINVGGKNPLTMVRLKGLFELLKLTEVVTYIQSGNIVFAAPANRSPADLGIEISALLHQETGNEIGVFVYTAEEFGQICRANPFIREEGIDIKKLHVVFLDSTPTPDVLKQLGPQVDGADCFIPAGRVIYLHCPLSYGKTRFSNQYFEKRLYLRATTRNWNTVNKLLKLTYG